MSAAAQLPLAYDAIRALNWSSLKHMAVSPLMYQWAINNPSPRKPAYVVGTTICGRSKR